MKNVTIGLITLALAIGATACQPNKGSDTADFQPIAVAYPDARRDTSYAETYAGYRVPAPYHWLEMPDSAATRQWLEAQRQLSGEYFERIPGREALRRKIQELWAFEAMEAPRKAGGAYYYLKRRAGQQYPGLYRRTGLEAVEEELLGQDDFSGDIHIKDFSVAGDGSLMALRMGRAGSGWEEIWVLNPTTGQLLPEVIEHVRYSNITWYKDGFYYSRYPASVRQGAGPYLFHQVYYHLAGTDPSEDQLVYADRSHPEYRFRAHLDAYGRYLVLSISGEGPGNAVYCREAGNPDAGFLPLVDGFDYQFEWAGGNRDGIYLVTDYGAPRRKLIRIDPELPAEKYWEEVLPSSPDPIREVHWINGQILVHYQSSGSSTLALFNPKGELMKRLKLPEQGTVSSLSGQPQSAEAFIGYSRFLAPPIVYRLDLEAQTLLPYHEAKTAFNPMPYEINAVRFQSYDDLEVPMFLIHKKGLKRTGNHPVLLFAGSSTAPGFQSVYNPTGYLLFPLFLEQGAICAVPALRSGAALESTRRKSGQGAFKQNTFDDFQAAAEYLIANDYTRAERIGAYGEGHGGLVVGASLTQRPDLFGAVVAQQGLFDMLRYPELGDGPAWLNEFGNPAGPSDFDPIFAYSPLHNLPPDDYPATLLLAPGPSSRPTAIHTWKFGAALQHQQQEAAPIVLSLPQNPPSAVETGAEVAAFLMYNLKVPMPQ